MKTSRPPLQGLHHLALRVRDIGKVKDFYVRIFGMRVVWEPDPQNCYLSSGTDNLALHEVTVPADSDQAPSLFAPLDHFGFLAETTQAVDAWARWASQNSVQILQPPQAHRDGSYSCYLADPEGNTIQILYEPTISSRPR